MKNTNVPIGNRTRHLPAYSGVPQPIAIPPTLFPSFNHREILYAVLASNLRANRPTSPLIFRVYMLDLL